jgi:hypothetical protein
MIETQDVRAPQKVYATGEGISACRQQRWQSGTELVSAQELVMKMCGVGWSAAFSLQRSEVAPAGRETASDKGSAKGRHIATALWT